jgi:octaprenyl-diphosphate synthase
MIDERLLSLIVPLAQPLAEVENTLIQECRSSQFEHINQAAQRITLDHGKRLRPILVLSAARSFGGIKKEHILFSVIIELIHTATLLHDDVLDEAEVRRHRKSVNAEWGNATSVMLGDYLFARALILLSDIGSKDIFRLVSEATRDVCEGELLQISSARNVRLSENTYFQIISKKTSSLFSSCCKGSALVSNAGPEIADALYRYGDLLGQAFQIIDDILDLVGDPSEEGKTLGTDLKKGKMTLPLIHLYRNLDTDEQKQLENMLTQKDVEIPDLHILNLLQKGQGFKETLFKINELCETALSIVNRFPKTMDLEFFKAVPEYLQRQAKYYLSEHLSALKV